MRVSQPCWNKPRRCPGWAGPGWTSPVTATCPGGNIRTRPRLIRDAVNGDWSSDHPGTNAWRFGRCDTCGRVTTPFALRRAYPTYWLDAALRPSGRRRARALINAFTGKGDTAPNHP